MTHFTDGELSTEEKWDTGAVEYATYADSPLGRLRSILTLETLERHLQSPPLSILEVGCGPGDLACALARLGHAVVACDSASAMVRLAEKRSNRLLPRTATGHIEFRCCDVFRDLHQFQNDHFDCITAHTVIDYLKNPEQAVEQLVSLLGTGGTLSLVRINHVSQVLRTILNKKDLPQALLRLTDRTVHSEMFDLTARSSTVEESVNLVESLGLDVIGVYGIRIFADYLPGEISNDPDLWQNLLQLERTVCDRRPYSNLGRYIHIVGIRR